MNAKAAVLQALDHPAHGLEVIRRLEERTGGRVRLKQGSVYPALRQLERDGLVRGWIPRASRARGRPRRYYELTLKGVQAASDLRAAMSSLVRAAPPPALSSWEIDRMRNRLRRCVAVSAVCMKLRQGALQAYGR